MSAANVGNPQSNNLYAYTQNFVDPSGLFMAPPRTDWSGWDNWWNSIFGPQNGGDLGGGNSGGGRQDAANTEHGVLHF